MTRFDGAFERDPHRVMRHLLFTDPPLEHVGFRPQHRFLTDKRGEPLWDALGRVEEMQAGYDAITARVGISSTPLDRVNVSRHADYRSYYTKELIDGVANIYATDLENFDYRF
jgi:hypothetical protein